MTQTGFVRISSNPSFAPEAVSAGEALALLDRITRLQGHGFWPDDLTVAAAFASRATVATHRQVTDGYLLALAVAHGGVLATLDRGIAVLARTRPESLELVTGNQCASDC
jgi:predicted nucleic acid-binding protein